MSLLSLPLPLLQDILSLIVCTFPYTSPYKIPIYPLLSLRMVNHLFDREIFKSIARNRLSIIPHHEEILLMMVYEFKFRLIKEHVGQRARRDAGHFCRHMHDIADDLCHLQSTYTDLFPEHIKAREDMLDDICHAIIRSGYHRKLFGDIEKMSDLYARDRERRPHRQRRPYRPKPAPRLRKPATPLEIRQSSFLIAIILNWEPLIVQLLKDPVLQNLQWQSRYFGQPLKTAMLLNHSPLVSLLLSYGARPIPTEYRGNKGLLEKIASRGHISVLREYYAYSNMHPSGWFDVARRAARRGHWDIVREIWSHMGPNIEGEKEIFLHDAAAQGRADVVQECLSGSVEVGRQNVWGYTALRCAVENGRVEVVRLLLDRGAMREAQKGDGNTKFFRYAVKGGSVEVIEMLVEHGLKPDWENRDVWPLMCSKGHVKMAKWYAEKRGGQGQHQDEGRLLAFGLLHAVVKRRMGMVRWLIADFGVEPKNRPKSSRKDILPLVLAIDAGNLEMVRLLVELGAIIGTSVGMKKFKGRERYLRRRALDRLRLTLELEFGQFGEYQAAESKIFGALRAARDVVPSLQVDVERLALEDEPVVEV